MKSIHAVWIALPIVIASAAACNFIINGQLKDYGEECKFSGRETTCGQCIVAHCTEQVNSVCVKTYDTNLSAIERCAEDPATASYYSDYPCDTFKVDGGVEPGNDKQNLSVCVRDNCIQGDNAPCKPPCEVDAGGVSACASCINSGCLAEMIPFCDDRNNGVLEETLKCAQNSSVASTYCNPFRNEQGVAMEGETIQTQEHNFKVCVRDKCMVSPKAACKTCPLKDKNNYPLESSNCGKCIQSQCNEELVACCASTDYQVNDLVQTHVASCAFPDYPPADCKAIFAMDAGIAGDCGLPQCMRDNCLTVCSTP